MNKEEFKQSSPLLPESSSQYNMKSDSPPSKPTLSIRKKKQRQEKQAFRNFADFDLPITQVPLANYKVFHSSLCDLRLPPLSRLNILLDVIEERQKGEQNYYYYIHYARRWLINEMDVSLASTLARTSLMQIISFLLDSTEHDLKFQAIYTLSLMAANQEFCEHMIKQQKSEQSKHKLQDQEDPQSRCALILRNLIYICKSTSSDVITQISLCFFNNLAVLAIQPLFELQSLILKILQFSSNRQLLLVVFRSMALILKYTKDKAIVDNSQEAAQDLIERGYWNYTVKALALEQTKEAALKLLCKLSQFQFTKQLEHCFASSLFLQNLFVLFYKQNKAIQLKVLLILGNLASSSKSLINRVLSEGGYLVLATLYNLLIEQQSIAINHKLIEMGVLVVAKIANRGLQEDIAPLAQNGTLIWVMKVLELTIESQQSKTTARYALKALQGILRASGQCGQEIADSLQAQDILLGAKSGVNFKISQEILNEFFQAEDGFAPGQQYPSSLNL